MRWVLGPATAPRANAGDGLRGSATAMHGRADADVIDAMTPTKAAQTIHAVR
ncbi:hypothetical protein LC55x_5628 [Lysobacter capsici]|nr:hypothetical protein LC55x_5628 [Lysobacter capsici]